MQAASRYAYLIIVALSVAALAACSSSSPSPAAACPDGWDQVTEYQLYFGLSDATGAPDAVSDEAWARFLADTVTPRFPDGLTVTDGAGAVAQRRGRNTEGTGQGIDAAGVARRFGVAAFERDCRRVRAALQPGIGAAYLCSILRLLQLSLVHPPT